MEAEVVKELAARGDVLGVFAAVVVAMLGFYLKHRADSKNGKAASKEREPIDRVLTRVQDIDERLIRVEADVDNMPTRQEFHDMDKSLVRLETRVAGIEHTTEKTGHAVGRIEDFMLKAAGNSK